MLPTTPEKLVNNVKEISTLPEVFMRLDSAINAPNSSFQYIADLISEDVALSLRILKVANSTLYGFPTPIETIPRAMSVIGTKELRDLILASTVVDMFADFNLPGTSMKDYWKHSIVCAVGCRVIAIMRRESNVERYYLAGILHDVGRLLVASQCQSQYQDIINECITNKRVLQQVEREVLGFDHCEVSGLLMRRWSVGDFHQECVRYYCDPSEAEHFPVAAAVVHLATIVANALDIGDAAGHPVPPMDESAWALLNLSLDDLDDIVEKVEEQYLEAVNIFLEDR